MRARRYSRRTEGAYLSWARRFVAFHRPRHAEEMGEAEVELFLYREVLGRQMALPGRIVRPKATRSLPVVLTPAEVGAVCRELSGAYRLVASMLYGSGLRLLECLTLRVKDVDLVRREIRVRRGKGARDRVTVLPEAMVGAVARASQSGVGAAPT